MTPLMDWANPEQRRCARWRREFEALITTAAGLFAAIPAVIAYNQFTHRMREFGARMDDFSMEILNFIERTTGVPTGVR